MKRKQIYFYHGKFSEGSARMNKIKSICTQSIRGDWFYEGSLDDFEEKWGEKFMVLKGEIGLDLICVTDRRTFGQR